MLPSQGPGRRMVGGDDRRRPPAVAAGNGKMTLATMAAVVARALLAPAATMAADYRQGAGGPAIALPMHHCYPSRHDPSWHAYGMAKRPDASRFTPLAL
jgi:Tfp pilus tip-associated adhesin PilY1